MRDPASWASWPPLAAGARSRNLECAISLDTVHTPLFPLIRMRIVSSIYVKRMNHNVNMLESRLLLFRSLSVPSLSHPVVCFSSLLLTLMHHNFLSPLSPSTLFVIMVGAATIKPPCGSGAAAGKGRFPSQFDLRRNFATA